MTTEELVKKLNSSDYVLAELKIDKSGPYDFILVGGTFSEKLLEVPTDATNWLDIWCDYDKCQDELNDATREFLGSTISQYLNTPISERKPEKKYRLEAVRHFSGPIAEKGYVKNVVCKTDYSGFEYSPVPFEFTEKQLETMKNNDPVLAPAIEDMKVEVNDDD